MIETGLDNNLQLITSGDKLTGSRPLVIGKPSEILIRCGADAEQNITITKKVIDKAMRPEVRDETGRMVGNTGHGLTLPMLVAAIKELDAPALIFRGRQVNSLLIITSIKDGRDRNIVVAIEFGRQEGFSYVNSIRSLNYSPQCGDGG